jgi:hypothetical protein
MSYLKLIMSQGNKNAELEIENSVGEERGTLLRGLLRFFGVKDPVDALKEGVITPNHLSEEYSIYGTQTSAAPIMYVPTAKKDQQPGRPKQLPLLGSERTMHTEIRELIAELPKEAVAVPALPEKPEWYKTGIMYKDGVPHYRLRYWCKNVACRDKGTEYILPDKLEFKCKTCGASHNIRPAAPKGERDGWGNFFIADQLIEGTEG